MTNPAASDLIGSFLIATLAEASHAGRIDRSIFEAVIERHMDISVKADSERKALSYFIIEMARKVLDEIDLI